MLGLVAEGSPGKKTAYMDLFFIQSCAFMGELLIPIVCFDSQGSLTEDFQALFNRRIDCGSSMESVNLFQPVLVNPQEASYDRFVTRFKSISKFF